MIDRDELKEIAYAMESAYKRHGILGDAVHVVAGKFPDLGTKDGILSAMWLAIDAYVDLNT